MASETHDTIEFDLPDGSIFEIDVPSSATDADIKNTLTELANSGVFSEQSVTKFKKDEPVTFGQLPEGVSSTSPVGISGEPEDNNFFSSIGKALGPLSSQLQPPKDVGRFEGAQLELTEPTKKGELPILKATTEIDPDKQSFQAGMALIGDVFSFSERSLGAVVEKLKDSDKSILAELGDPNASITKGLKERIRNSDANGVLKFLGEAGLSIVSDPLFIGGIAKQAGKAGVSSVKTFRKGFVEGKAAKTTTTSGAIPEIPVTPELREQAANVLGSGVPDRVKTIQTTPGEEQFLKGIVDEELLAKEAIAKQRAPEIVKRITEAREKAFSPNIVKRGEDTGIPDLLSGSNEIFGSVARDFKKAFSKFKKTNDEQFGYVDELGDQTKISKIITDEIGSEINNLLPPKILAKRFSIQGKPFRKAGDLTNDEIRHHVSAKTLDFNALYDDAGRIVSKEQIIAKKAAEKASKKIDSSDLKQAGLSREVLDEVDDAVVILSREETPSFTELRNTRKSIAKLEKKLLRETPATNDMKTLGLLRGKLTDAMKNHMQDIGEDALSLFKTVDARFADESTINILAKNFYEDATISGGKKMQLKPPNEIFDSILNSKQAGLKIAGLKKSLPPESYTQLQNAYFNRIFEKSSSGGIISPNKFINTVDKMKDDVRVWDELLTDDMKDVLAESILEAVVLRDLKKFKTPKAIEEGMSNLLKKGSSFGIRFAMARIFGFGVATVMDIGRRLLTAKAAALEAKEAKSFFRSVDPSGFIQGLKQGAGAVKQGVVIKAKKAITPQESRSFRNREGFSPTNRAVISTGAKEELREEEFQLEATP